MADSSFYPGYVPEATDVNPMFPGYFPGQKLPKVYRNIQPMQGLDFNMDTLLEELSALELELTNQGGYLPGWVKDRLVDDFKTQLKATIKKPDTDVETLDEYDANALPGAFGLSLNLNPLDWAKDPGKTAGKTLNSWKNAVVNWGDVETRVKENLWRQVVEVTPDYSRVVGAENSSGTAPMAQATAGRITSRMRATASKYENDSGIAISGIGLIDKTHGDYSLKSQGVDQTYRIDSRTGDLIVDPKTGAVTHATFTTIDDELANVGAKVIEFEKNTSFAPRRDSTFDEFETSVFDAVSKELNYSKPINDLIKTGDPSLKKAYEVFEAKHTIVNTMDSIGKAYSKKGVKAALEDLAMEGDTDKLITFEKDSAGNVIIDPSTGKAKVLYKKDAFGTVLTNARTGEPIPVKDIFYNYRERVDDALEDLDKKLFSSTATLQSNMSKEEFAAMQKMMTPYRAHLKEMRDRVEHARTTIGTLDVRATGAQRAAAIRELRVIDQIASGGFAGKGLTGGDMVVESFQRSLLRNMSDEFTQRRAKSGIGYLITELERKNKGELRVSRLKTYVDRLRFERDSDAVDTVIDMLEKGNLMESLVWNRIKRYLTGVAPSYYTEQVLKKLSYFGLIIADDAKFEKHAFIKGASGVKKAFGATGEAPGKLYGNWFNIKHTGKYDILDPITGTNVSHTVTFSGKIWGGAHFEGMNGLFSMRKLVDSGELTPQALAYMIMNVDPASGGFLNPAFMKKLASLNGNKGVVPKDAEKFALQLVALREWVNKNSAKLGSNVNTADTAYWLGLIDALKKNSGPGIISLSRRYAGLLEKLAAKLNYLQNLVLRKIGKYLAPIAYLKTIVVEAVSEAIIKLLDIVAGAASGGTLTILTEGIARILRPIIRFFVRRVVDTFQTLVKGVMQGDIFLVFAAFEKTFLKFMRVTLIIVGIPFMIVMAFAEMFVGSTLTTYSPVDPTSPSTVHRVDFGGGIDYAAGPGIPPPDVPPIVTGGNITCSRTNDEGESMGRCRMIYPSYGAVIGHGTDSYWDAPTSGSHPEYCRYSIPYIAFPDLTWSAGGVCIGSCSPTFDEGSACYRAGGLPTGWNQVPYYGFAADFDTTCTGDYAKAIMAPNIAGVSSWTLTETNCANGSIGNCAVNMYYANLSGVGGGHVVSLHVMHLVGIATKPSYTPGEVIQNYGEAIPHVHVEIKVDGELQMPENVFSDCSSIF